MNRAQTTLVVSLFILGVAANWLSTMTWNLPFEFLEGRWVLDTVEYQGIVTHQQPDALEIYHTRIRRLPEEYDLPIDPLQNAVFFQFDRSELQTFRVFRSYKGRYEMYPSAQRPIALDGGQVWNIELPGDQWTNPSDRRPFRVRMEINPNGFCLITDNLAGDKWPVVVKSDRTVIMSFVKL